MNKMTDYSKAQKELVKALRALNAAAEIIEALPDYNNRLWDYVTDENGYKPYQEQFNPANGLFLDYFRFNGRTFAIEQIIGIGSIADCIGHSSGYIENKQEHFLSGYDCENYYSPIFVELDEYGEKVRIYEEV